MLPHTVEDDAGAKPRLSAHSMFIALSLQVLGLAMASLPSELRRQNGLFLLSAAWIGVCLSIIAALVIVLPADDPIWVGKDRFTYDAAYTNAVAGTSPDFEILFSLMTDFIAALTSNSDVYFLLLFFGTVALLHVSISHLFRPGDWIIVYFFYFNYFVFFQAALNAVRQGLGVALCCVAIVYFLKDRLRLSCLLIVLASLIHSSCIFSFAIFLARIPGATVWRLVFAVFAVFAMSRAGVTELVFNGLLNLAGIYPKHLFEYSSGAWALHEYTGGIYRIDFLVFSLLALIPYTYLSWRRDSKYSPAFILYDKLMKVYSSLIIPFAFFSFMMFSDRYALPTWILLPMMVIWPLLYMEEAPGRRTWAIRTVLLTLIAVLPNLIAYETTLLRICLERL